MRGSLAIWCETNGPKVDGHNPRVELHFNIWRDLLKNSPDVFDFGILFKDLRAIQRLFISIPAEMAGNQIKDLSNLLKDQTTLSAIFNDTLSIATEIDINGGGFAVKKAGPHSRVVLFICHILESDFRVEPLDGEAQSETLITFEKHFFDRFRNNVVDQYIRMRIILDQDLTKLFVTQIEPLDRFLLSSFYQLETIEFRLNEKRNFSKQLRMKYYTGDEMVIETIHYFLIRDLRVELNQAHTAFRKMRRLEPRLWENYLKALGVSRDTTN